MESVGSSVVKRPLYSYLLFLLLRTLQIVSVVRKGLGVGAHDEIGGHGAHVLDGDATHGWVGVHDETQHDLEQKVDGKRRNGTLRQEQVAAEEKERRHGADVHFLSVLRVTGRWK